MLNTPPCRATHRPLHNWLDWRQNLRQLNINLKLLSNYSSRVKKYSVIFLPYCIVQESTIRWPKMSERLCKNSSNLRLNFSTRLDLSTRRLDFSTPRLELLTRRLDFSTPWLELLPRRLDLSTRRLNLWIRRHDLSTRQLDLLSRVWVGSI